jgi:protein translocase SecG subunit
MSFVIPILTLLLVFNCMLLILLVLVQLPKKDAGAGIAFGAGTADALFGAGSGNALTKITKYAAGVFLGLSLFLGFLQSKSHSAASASDFTKRLEQQQQQQLQKPVQQPGSQTPPPAAHSLLTTTPLTNAPAPAAPPTNSVK